MMSLTKSGVKVDRLKSKTFDITPAPPQFCTTDLKCYFSSEIDECTH